MPPIWLALIAAPVAVWAIERGAARIESGPPTAVLAAVPTWLAMLALAAAIATIAAIGFEGAEAWIAAGLGWTLLALARIDAAHGLLPDVLTLPLAAAGLAIAGLRDPGFLPEAALGAALGFGALALIGWAYRRWRGRDGLGLGDAKLLGAGGAWLGAAALPLTVCLAATAALIAVLAARLAGRRLDEEGAIPFGPFLCLAVWIVFLLREGMLRA